MQITANRWVELGRRLFLVLAIAAAAWCFMWFDSSPLIKISEYKEKTEGYYHQGSADSLLPPEERVLNRVNTIKVSGPEWQVFFTKVIDCFESDKPLKGWENRVDSLYREGWSLLSLWFKPQEEPLAQIVSQMKINNSHYILLKDTGQILEAYYRSMELPGFNASIIGPAAFLYPYRHLALPLVAAAFLFYLLLPWPSRRPNLIQMKRGQVVLMDIVGIIIFALFFGLPFLITGSSQTLLNDYLFFAAVFWILAALALLMLYWSLWYACYQVSIENGSLTISSLSGTQQWRLGDIAEYQPAIWLPPRWLIRLMWIAAILGRRPGAAGQAILLSSTEQGGILLKNRDGRQTYIWTTNSMGMEAFENLESLKATLEQAGVPANAEPLEIRALFPPTK